MIAPGTVLHIFFNDIGTPKFKFGVLVCLEPLRFFLINTRLSNFVHNNAAARRAQIEIDAASHTFLQYDSLIDCTESYDGGLTIDTLRRHVAGKPQAIRGTISDAVRANIMMAVAESRLLSSQEKDEILEGFGRAEA